MIKRLCLSMIMLFTIVFGASALTLEASSTPKINGPAIIQKEQMQVLTLSDILALYSSDLGSVSIQEDLYTGNGAVIGIYEIELIASNGEEQTTKTIEVQVLSSIGYKVRAVTDRVNIHIAKSNKLSITDIATIHSRTGVTTLNHTSQLEILSDAYSGNETEAGVYLVEYRLMDATGLDKVISCTITVHESERIQNPIQVIPVKPKSQWFKKLLNTITSIAILVAAIVAAYFIIKKVGRKKR